MLAALGPPACCSPFARRSGRGMRVPGSRCRQPARAQASQHHNRGGSEHSGSEGKLDVEAAAARILESSPGAKARLDRIEAAQLRVIELQAAQAEVEAQLSTGRGIHTKEALPTVLQVQRMEAAADLTAAARAYQMAEQEASAADRIARDARSSALKMVWMLRGQDQERVQSGVAGTVGAAGGLLVQLPLVAGGGGSAPAAVATLMAAAVSSALFGVLWRYVVRNDADAADLQLKGGCIAAFALTSGLAQAAALVTSAGAFTSEVLAHSALLSGQAMLQYTAAAVTLEAAVQRGTLQRRSET